MSTWRRSIRSPAPTVHRRTSPTRTAPASSTAHSGARDIKPALDRRDHPVVVLAGPLAAIVSARDRLARCAAEEGAARRGCTFAARFAAARVGVGAGAQRRGGDRRLPRFASRAGLSGAGGGGRRRSL